MRATWLLLLAASSMPGCVMGPVPVLVHWTNFLRDAELVGMSRAEVIGELGLPTAISADERCFLYALRDANWFFVVTSAAIDLDPHWDVRFVEFDSMGRVQSAPPMTQRAEPFEKLVGELDSGSWRH